MNVQIKSRFTDAVLFEGEYESLKDCVVAAVEARAYLADANLADANLADAHCRAGWAITLAGEAGKVLEAKYGPQRAGTYIYRASTGHVPHFFASTEHALEDIKRCAEEAM